ncbi:hypothetical protein BJ508DRAFT_418498 [Ascobolus immersus RN42]|uniref:Uncharacterized protein n=1 Tax=Ascobolus immersus RN42 TaxID=1160509 RepID=A0A3N4HP37_ASCIM|nr:hypothetical protein BJ508DRAFT_418498 [Ascobolus immersus RN42]
MSIQSSFLVLLLLSVTARCTTFPRGTSDQAPEGFIGATSLRQTAADITITGTDSVKPAPWTSPQRLEPQTLATAMLAIGHITAHVDEALKYTPALQRRDESPQDESLTVLISGTFTYTTSIPKPTATTTLYFPLATEWLFSRLSQQTVTIAVDDMDMGPVVTVGPDDLDRVQPGAGLVGVDEKKESIEQSAAPRFDIGIGAKVWAMLVFAMVGMILVL